MSRGRYIFSRLEKCGQVQVFHLVIGQTNKRIQGDFCENVNLRGDNETDSV